jgi:hypothetical protein
MDNPEGRWTISAMDPPTCGKMETRIASLSIAIDASDPVT